MVGGMKKPFAAHRPFERRARSFCDIDVFENPLVGGPSITGPTVIRFSDPTRNWLRREQAFDCAG